MKSSPASLLTKEKKEKQISEPTQMFENGAATTVTAHIVKPFGQKDKKLIESFARTAPLYLPHCEDREDQSYKDIKVALTSTGLNHF